MSYHKQRQYGNILPIKSILKICHCLFIEKCWFLQPSKKVNNRFMNTLMPRCPHSLIMHEMHDGPTQCFKANTALHIYAHVNFQLQNCLYLILHHWGGWGGGSLPLKTVPYPHELPSEKKHLTQGFKGRPKHP